jgi:hypothetical protein
MSRGRIRSLRGANGIRVTLTLGATVFGLSAVLLIALPEFFLDLLALDYQSDALVWSMRMIGVTLVALAGNMWVNSTNADDRAVRRVGLVMAVAAGGLGVVTLVIPVALSWFTLLYATVGFAFSVTYVFFLFQSRK